MDGKIARRPREQRFTKLHMRSSRMNTATAMCTRSSEAARAASATTGYPRSRNGTVRPANGGTTSSVAFAREQPSPWPGRMAESIFEDPIGSHHEEVLIAESADPIYKGYGFEYGSLEKAFNHATSAFGDHNLAARWLKAALPGLHANTRRILKQNWPQLLRRAHELNQTLRRARER